MATKFTPALMASMGQLFITRSADELQSFENELADAANAAGVYLEAVREGLTMAQWTIVRDPRVTLREAVLAAE